MRARPPLYVRLLRLRHLQLRPSAIFVLLEGSLALGVLLALAEVVSVWGVLAVPVAVAAMVKFNDVVAGVLKRSFAISPPYPIGLQGPGYQQARGRPARGVAAVPRSFPGQELPGPAIRAPDPLLAGQPSVAVEGTGGVEGPGRGVVGTGSGVEGTGSGVEGTGRSDEESEPGADARERRGEVGHVGGGVGHVGGGVGHVGGGVGQAGSGVGQAGSGVGQPGGGVGQPGGGVEEQGGGAGV